MTEDAFTERVETYTHTDDSYIGRADIRVDAGSYDEQEKVRRLEDECNRLRDRVAELTRLLAEAQP
jgi:hypothetical protein